LRIQPYYLALVNPTDLAHARAVDLSESLLGRTFVTEYVLVELGNCLSRGLDRLIFPEVLEKVESDDDTVVVPASPSLFRQDVALFASRPDKDWSLVDCISFIVMKQRRVNSDN
jgi:predicted nucleic acid-binding protein